MTKNNMSKKAHINKTVADSIKIETWFAINNSEATLDAEKRLVTGVSISETINCRNQIYDYVTSKQYMLQYVADAEKRTNGASKGAVRIMHNGTLAPVGIITDLTFDDAAKIVYATIHIQDDDAWAKIVEHVYTAFSWGGRSVGPVWVDDIATAELGKQVVRYTFKPTELSLVDVPAVPDTIFTNIENSDNGDTMAEEVKPANIAESIKGEVGREEVIVPASLDIKNGVCEGNALAAHFEQLVAITEWVSQLEEPSEGQDQTVPDDLKAGLLALKPAIQAYQKAQLDELLPEAEAPVTIPSDYDVEDEEPIEDSATPAKNATDTIENAAAGHDFFGNGKAPAATEKSPASKASLSAHKASVDAHASGDKADHEKAAELHNKAADMHEAAKHVKMAAHHKAMADYHTNAAKADDKDDSKEAPVEDDKQNSATPAPATNEVVIENAKTAPDYTEQFKMLMDRIDGLEAKINQPIENSAQSVIPVVAPKLYGNTKVVTREMDTAEVAIQNGAIDVDAEAQRIASLPKDKQVAALIAYQLAGKRRN